MESCGSCGWDAGMDAPLFGGLCPQCNGVLSRSPKMKAIGTVSSGEVANAYPRGMTLVVTWSGGRCERFTVQPGDRVVVGTGAAVATVPLFCPDGPELVTVEIRGDECPGLVLVEQEVTPDPEVRAAAASTVEVLDLATGQLGAAAASSPAAYPGGNPALTHLLAEDIDGVRT